MPQTTLRVPYTQQFSPGQTPLSQLLPILRQNAKKEQMRQAIAGAFFSGSDNSEKLAGNTLLALRAYGIINDSNELEFFGKELIACQGKPELEAHETLAKHIIFEMDGIVLVETLRDMHQASMEITLTSLPSELQKRGLAVNESSSDLSAVLGWLREAKILNGYAIDYDQFQKVTGFTVETLNIAKKLSVEQFMFLRGMVALGIEEWVSYEIVTNHTEGIYAGQVKYNRKSIVKSVIDPLRKAGLIEFKKKIKEDTSTPEGRGGKPGDVRPTEYFNKTFADPFLEALFRAAGFNDLREIRSRSISSILDDIKQTADMDKSGKALEILAVRLCQLLELDFLGWRETDTNLTGGGEVDAMLHSTRLIYSRWQVQCKIGQITLEAVAKEVGLSNVSLANVILLMSTGNATESALTFKDKIMRSSNLNIIFVEGSDLERIAIKSSVLLDVLHKQARDALEVKPAGNMLWRTLPSQERKRVSSEREHKGAAKKGKASAAPANEPTLFDERQSPN